MINAPCKGATNLSFSNRKSYWFKASLLSQPFRLDNQTHIKPRAMPWALLFQPFRLNKFEASGVQIVAGSFSDVDIRIISTPKQSIEYIV
jgi:hypothetical protein